MWLPPGTEQPMAIIRNGELQGVGPTLWSAVMAFNQYGFDDERIELSFAGLVITHDDYNVPEVWLPYIFDPEHVPPNQTFMASCSVDLVRLYSQTRHTACVSWRWHGPALDAPDCFRSIHLNFLSKPQKQC